MTIRIRTLAISEILVGYIFNTVKQPIKIPIRIDNVFNYFDPNTYLIIESLFTGIIIENNSGDTTEYPRERSSKDYYDLPIKHLRSLIKSGLKYEINGDNNKDDLEFLKKVNPAIYDKIESRIVWKGKKRKSL